jgi:hypothetical protein
MKKIAFLLLVALAACVPTARYLPPDTPIFYPTGYRSLFSATLQELTAAYVPDGLGRRTFSITQADPETGLITAVRSEQGTTANLRYRFPDEDQGTVFGLGFNLLVPVPVTPQERTIITIVVRPQGRGASIIYSTQGPDGSSSGDAERLMRGVIAKLDARFLMPVQRLEPLEPATP